MIEHHEVGGRAADTSAYLEAPMNGVRGRHTKARQLRFRLFRVCFLLF